jgi:hypothetical protein
MMPEMSMWRSVLTISEELRNQTSKNTATRDSTSADLSGHFHGSCDSVSPFEKEPGAAPKEWVNERGTRLCEPSRNDTVFLHRQKSARLR